MKRGEELGGNRDKNGGEKVRKREKAHDERKKGTKKGE